MDTRWSTYIDIEEFRALYEKNNAVLRALGDLMDGIYLIGTTCYAVMPSRIFAHQTGDGFATVSEFGAASLDFSKRADHELRKMYDIEKK